MDGSQFDRVTRAFSTRLSRRSGVVFGLAALASVGTGRADVGANGGRRGVCRPAGAGCTRNNQCCSAICETSRSLPRNRRNRCLCIPSCDGRVCGSDGCGGSCGDSFPVQCNDEGQLYSVCEDYADTDDNGDQCLADVDGHRYEVSSAWYKLETGAYKDCTANDECQSLAICGVGGYTCSCIGSRKLSALDTPFWLEDRALCVVHDSAVGPRTCDDTGYGGHDGCAITIEGVLVGYDRLDPFDYAGADYDDCTSNAQCVALDPDACAAPGATCACLISWGQIDGEYETGGASCQLMVIER